MFTHVHYTFSVDMYVLTTAEDGKVYSFNGAELSAAGRQLAHSFPCNCDKALSAHHLA